MQPSCATFVMELRTVKGLRQQLLKCFHRGFTCSHELLLKPQVKQLRFEKGKRSCREGSEGAQRVCATAGKGKPGLWSQAGRGGAEFLKLNNRANSRGGRGA